MGVMSGEQGGNCIGPPCPIQRVFLVLVQVKTFVDINQAVFLLPYALMTLVCLVHELPH